MYFQTWNKVTKIRRWPFIGPTTYAFIQWFCGKVTGHESSKTEWGYGGGQFADSWCRWCNKLIPVQKTIIMFQNKEHIETMKEVERNNTPPKEQPND